MDVEAELGRLVGDRLAFAGYPALILGTEVLLAGSTVAHLDDLADRARTLDSGQWPGLAAEWVGTLLDGTFDDAWDILAHGSFDRIRHRLRLHLVDADSPAERWGDFGESLFVAVGFDTPLRIVYLSSNLTSRFDPHMLYAAADAGTWSEPIGDVETMVGPTGQRFVIAAADSHPYSSGRLTDPGRLAVELFGPAGAPNGMLAAVPAGGVILAHPVAGPDSLSAVEALSVTAADIASGTGGLCPEVFYLRDGHPAAQLTTGTENGKRTDVSAGGFWEACHRRPQAGPKP